MPELFLLARIAGRPIAIGADQVGSAVDIGEIVPVPLSDARVRGLAALRSRIVTVIDPRELLDADAAGPLTRAVIVPFDGHHYAVLVDSVDDVVSLSLAPLARGMVLAPGWREAARGIVEIDGAPVLVVDPRAWIGGYAAAA